MTNSIRARLVMVLTSAITTFLAMAALAATVTIARDVIVNPKPIVHNVRIAYSTVQMGKQPAFIPKMCFPEYRAQHEALERQWAEEDRQAEQRQLQQQQAPGAVSHDASHGSATVASPGYDEVANDFGHRDGPGLVAQANDVLARALVAGVNRLVALPVVGTFFEGRLGKRTSPASSVVHHDPNWSFIQTSPYVDPVTGALEENVRAIDDSPQLQQIARQMPSAIPFLRELDAVKVSLYGNLDVRPLWDWNTKAIYIAFLARYATPKMPLNEVLLLDVIVRDVSLPWPLRHLRGSTAATRSPEEEQAYQQFLESVRHPVHDARGAWIDPVAKTVTLHDASKYGLADFYANTLAHTEVEVVIRYQVMSYSGWSPVREFTPDKQEPPMVIRPTQGTFDM